MRSRIVGLLGVAIVGLALTGCDSSSADCKNGSCDVTVSGKPDVNLGSKATSRPYRRQHLHVDQPRFTVVRYMDNAVTISSGAQTDTVRVGETKTINHLVFQVRSVDRNGNGAKLRVQLG